MTKTTDKEKVIYQWASLVAQWYTISLQGRSHRRLRFDPQVGKIPGGGNGNPLQYSCLENLMDRGTSWTMVHGVTESDMTETT